MKNWLIRTKSNYLFGPVDRDKVLDLIRQGTIGDDDEICQGNGYWIYLRERELVDKYLHHNQEQNHNPVSEAPYHEGHLDTLEKPEQAAEKVGGQEHSEVSANDSSHNYEGFYDDDDEEDGADQSEQPEQSDESDEISTTADENQDSYGVLPAKEPTLLTRLSELEASGSRVNKQDQGQVISDKVSDEVSDEVLETTEEIVNPMTWQESLKRKKWLILGLLTLVVIVLVVLQLPMFDYSPE